MHVLQEERTGGYALVHWPRAVGTTANPTCDMNLTSLSSANEMMRADLSPIMVPGIQSSASFFLM